MLKRSRPKIVKQVEDKSPQAPLPDDGTVVDKSGRARTSFESPASVTQQGLK